MSTDVHIQSRRQRQIRSRISQSVLYLCLIAGACLMMLPFAYMVGVAFTKNALILQTPPTFIPKEATLENFTNAWSLGNFGQAFFNSLFVAVSATILNVALASMLAFAFARYQFPGKHILFYGMLSTMTVPGLVLIIPQFVLASNLGLTNSLFGMILVYAAGMAFGVYMLRSFFEELPQELFDAAAIDGCGAFRSYLTIGLPLAKPAIATAIIFGFTGNWDEFVWALTSTNDPNLYTLPVALQQFFVSQGTTNWGIVFAGSTIAVLPVIIIFLVFQRYIVGGLAGALKG